ncbi:MAG: hypothetical protein HY329_03395 [Chloroflexi bacterium]|nr:hypothetical protein [Chloroflexota bacterium]
MRRALRLLTSLAVGVLATTSLSPALAHPEPFTAAADQIPARPILISTALPLSENDLDHTSQSGYLTIPRSHAPVLPLSRLSALTPSLSDSHTFKPSHSPADQATGTIAGRVLNGTTKDPAGGITVNVRSFNNGQPGAERSTVAGADGSFTFDGLVAGPAFTYVLTTEYGGMPYASQFLALTGEVTDVTLTVYETTTSAEAVRVAQLTHAFEVGADERRWLYVVTGVSFDNRSARAFVGEYAQGTGVPLPLLAGAQDVQPISGINPNRLRGSEPGNGQPSRYFARTPLPPGTTIYAFQYRIPYENAETTVSVPVLYPVADLRVLTPARSFTVTGAGLESGGNVTLDTREYRLYGTRDLAAGTTYDVRLLNLPAGVVWSALPVQSYSRGAALTLAPILAALAIAYPFYRRRQLSSSFAVTKTPTAPLDPPTAPPSDSVLSTQHSVLSALAALDDAHEAGALDRAEYERRRAELKRTAVTAWHSARAPEQA